MEHKSQDWHRADIESALEKKNHAQRSFSCGWIIARFTAQCIYPKLAQSGADHCAGARNLARRDLAVTLSTPAARG